MSMAQVNSYVVNAEKLLNLREVFATTAMAHNFDAEPPLSKKIEVTRDRADVVFWGPQEEARNSKMVEVVVDPLEVETILGSN